MAAMAMGAMATGAIPDILIRRTAMPFRSILFPSIPMRRRHRSTAITAGPMSTEATEPIGYYGVPYGAIYGGRYAYRRHYYRHH